MITLLNFFNSKLGCMLRAIVYIALTYICPIIFIAIKFALFKKTDAGIKFTGGGLIALGVVGIGAFKGLKWVCNNFAYNYWLGVLNGFISTVLWLLLGVAVLCMVTKYIDKCLFVLGWSTLTCFIGIFINPFPLMAHKSKVKALKDAINN